MKRCTRYFVKILAGLLLTTIGGKAVAQPPFIYQQITNSSGLSNSSINCIFQDSLGLMWFGTWDGLNVYNGNAFKVYKPEAKNNNSISNNIIRDIVEERKGILWIATDEGVNRFDAHTRQFKRFYFQPGQQNSYREKSYLLARSKTGTIFCAVYELGLSYYNPEKDEFIPLQIPGVNTFMIKTLFFDDWGNLWILQQSGVLNKVSLSKDREGGIKAAESKQIAGNLAPLQSIHRDDNILWLVDSKHSIHRLSIQNEQLAPIVTAVALQPVIRSITAMTTHNGYLLMAHATGGVYRCLIKDNQMVAHERLFSPGGVFSFFKGSQQILWVGTDGQGIYKVYPNQKEFIHHADADIPGITNNPIRAFCEVAPGQLYTGTKGGGLFRIINSHNNPVVEKIDTKSGLNNNAVYSLYNNGGNMLWIGTDGMGIQMLDIKTNRLYHFFSDSINPATPEFGSVYAICETGDSSIWLGTSGYGLIRLKIGRNGNEYVIKSSKKYSFIKNKEHWLSSNIIYSLYPGKGNVLWIGTRGGGLNKFNYGEEKFESFQSSDMPNSLSSNDVLCIMEDASGKLWIGTSNGINSFSATDGKGKPVFVNYFEKNGLPNNTVHGIIEDENNKLWISTNNGISWFDPQKKSFVNFTVGDGLQNNEFSDGAYYRSRFDKRIYFGGINGFNSFYPSSITTSNFSPAVHLNTFKLYNSEEVPALFSGEKGLQGLSLAYDQNFFSIDFVALDFINNEKCEYAYLLENFNKDWIQSGTAHSADFTNVPPGNYVLKIRATNSDRVWSAREFSLPVHIRLPWWKTPVAYVVYGLMLIAALYGIYRLLKLRIRYNRSLWEERVNRQKEEEIHEAKLRFFTNIAHEFCTPLTLIYGPCEKILGHKFSDSYIRRFVQIIKSNAERMLTLIQQLMDFRKTEAGYLPLQAEDIDIVEMTRYIADSFSEIVDRNQVQFTVNVDPAVQEWCLDRSSLEKILYNLLSNAFKYTPPKGTVSLDIALQDEQLRLVIKNSGKGIKKEEIDQLFDRFKILDNFEAQGAGGMNMRTGLGLLLTKGLVTQLNGSIEMESEVGKTTTVTVLLPELQMPVHNPQPAEVTEEPVITLSPASLAMEAGFRMPENMEADPDRHGKLLVMVVDDDKDIRDFLFDMLSEKYAVVEADSAKKAYGLLKEKLPNIIICDVLMKDIDGFDFTKEIKTNILTRHIPVILLTGRRTVEDQIKGASAGADAYLPKPFYPYHLNVVIERLLISRKELKEYYSSSAANIEFYNGNLVSHEDHDFITKVTQFIEHNLENENLNSGFICTELGISRMQLYRKVRDITGLSPSKFIRTVRLKFASRLILSTSKTIQEIMFESGFNNKAYFFREFNKMFNTSPGDYRNTHQHQLNNDNAANHF